MSVLAKIVVLKWFVFFFENIRKKIYIYICIAQQTEKHMCRLIVLALLAGAGVSPNARQKCSD